MLTAPSRFCFTSRTQREANQAGAFLVGAQYPSLRGVFETKGRPRPAEESGENLKVPIWLFKLQNRVPGRTPDLLNLWTHLNPRRIGHVRASVCINSDFAAACKPVQLATMKSPMLPIKTGYSTPEFGPWSSDVFTCKVQKLLPPSLARSPTQVGRTMKAKVGKNR